MPAAPAFDVLGIGENSVDEVYRLETYPKPGSSAKAEIRSHTRSAGGQVATTVCTCAKLGLAVSYLGAFGDDENGTWVRQELRRRGVDMQHAVVRRAPNRHAVILVDESTGERVVLWQRDRALALTAGDVPAAVVGRARLLHVDAVDEAVAIHAARLGRAAGMPVTSDIDRVTEHTRDLVTAVTVPIFADGVAETLMGVRGTEAALRALRRHHSGLLCATRGERGAVLLAGHDLHEAPGLSIDAVDTTGAGDVFRGAFIYALLTGQTPAGIVRFANAAAAASCTREGAMGGVPSLEDVREMLSRGAP